MMRTETIVLPKDKVVNEANVNAIIGKRHSVVVGG